MSKSKFDYDDAPPEREPARIELWDMLSILTLLLTLCIGAYFVAVFANPSAAFNLLKPGRNDPPTPTITQIQPPSTWTPTLPGPSETPTLTLLPTITLPATPTLVSLITPSVTPTPTRTPKAPFTHTISQISSEAYHPELGCNWQGVAGRVVGPNNEELNGYIILLNGFYNGKSFEEYKAAGIAQIYGRSGFEFQLETGSSPIDSKGLLAIQVFDFQSGRPVTDKIPIDTSSDCSRNLVIVLFKKNP